jgi:tetratricopeptide (TPR) repeat protein
MYVLSCWYDKFTFWRVLLGGVFLGLFALVRPNVLLFGAVVLAWSWWVGRRHNKNIHIGMVCLGFVLGTVMVVAPATFRNYIVANDFVLISANGGINLYMGNNENATGVVMENIAGIEQWQIFDYPKIVRDVEAKQGKKMKYSQVSSYFARKALNYILKHPGRTLKLMVLKTAFFWGPIEIANIKQIHYEKKNSITLRYLPGFPMALSFALVGFIWLILGRKGLCEGNKVISSVTPRQWEISIIGLLFVLTYFLSFLPFFVAGRFRVPIIPFLLLFGAYGLYRTGQLLIVPNLYRAAWWVLIYVVLFIAASIPITAYRPNLVGWHYSRGDTYRLTGKFDLAVEEFRKVISLNPAFPNAHRMLGVIFEREKNYIEAIEHFKSEVEINPNSSDNHYNLAVALAKNGQVNNAIKEYRKALQLEPENIGALYNLGHVFHEQNKYNEAVKYYTRALELDPGLDKAHFNLANILLDRQRFKQAVVHYKQAIASRPDWSAAQDNLRIAQTRLRRFEERMTHWKESLRADPNRADVHNNLGIAYLLENKLEQAIHHLNMALKLEPDLADALNNLAWLFAVKENSLFYNPPEAVKLAQRACELTEFKRPDFLDTLAIAYASVGRFPEAIKNAEKAINLAQRRNLKLAEEIKNRLELYNRDRPYSQNTP